MSELRVRVDRIRYENDQFTERLLERWRRNMEALQAALIATAPPPITIRMWWRPAPPENRRLPMPLKYG